MLEKAFSILLLHSKDFSSDLQDHQLVMLLPWDDGCVEDSSVTPFQSSASTISSSLLMFRCFCMTQDRALWFIMPSDLFLQAIHSCMKFPERFTALFSI